MAEKEVKSKRGDKTLSNTYGYIRVSSTDQNEDRQLLAMQDKQVPLKSIFIDKQSGKDFERLQYKKACKKIESRRFALYSEHRPAWAQL